MKDNKKKSRQ